MYNDKLSIVYTPLNLQAHKFPQYGGGSGVGGNNVLKIPQGGEGLGSLFRSFIKWIIPAGKSVIKSVVKSGAKTAKAVAKSDLVKDAAKTLQKEAINAGIDVAQTALKGGDVKKTLKVQTKKMGQNLGGSVSKSLDALRPNDQGKIVPNLKRSIKKKKKKEKSKRIKFNPKTKSISFNDNLG